MMHGVSETCRLFVARAETFLFLALAHERAQYVGDATTIFLHLGARIAPEERHPDGHRVCTPSVYQRESTKALILPELPILSKICGAMAEREGFEPAVIRTSKYLSG